MKVKVEKGRVYCECDRCKKPFSYREDKFAYEDGKFVLRSEESLCKACAQMAKTAAPVS